ncbi:PAS domain-containing protein [Roseomonas sp. SSH11]|uniref:histidine kinase n=1 Tax=Pararoseomonas baculiformis TaxID=2820812 RepID=A0ABS4A8Y6_9PROT|nr:PAS domain-containing protein [Pararoseomonas baculiformis]MBP0443462.1 PAS domain-containing protein [Pararoseomonas baculiformis]
MPERLASSTNHGQGLARLAGPGIRARLVLLVLATVLPVLGFAGLVLWRFAEAQRDLVEQSVLTRAEGVARAIDAEFASLTSALRAVGVTTAFQSGDLEGVHRHLVAVAGDLRGYLSLRDAEGHLLLHTAFPFGHPLAAVPRPDWAMPKEGAPEEPQVIDLFGGTRTGSPIYGVSLPVRDAAGRRYLLGAGMRADRLSERLAGEVREPGWSAMVVDRNQRIVARAPVIPDLVGRQAGARFRQEPHGIQRGRTVEGVPAVIAHAETSTGWTIGTSLEAEVVDAPVRQAVWALLGVGALLLACALLLALWAAARIARATRTLSAAAVALGQGEAVPAVRTAVREVDLVGDALSRAASALAVRDAALREREAQLAQTQRLARVGGFEIVVTYDAEGRPAFHNHRSPEYLALHGLKPEAAEEPHGAWLRRIHPEDRARVSTHFAASVEGTGTDYVSEYRVMTPAGEMRWISALAEIERDATGRATRLRGVHVDVSALRRTEAELAENQAALAAAEERLRLALSAGGLVAFDLDLTTGQAVYSPGHFELLGLPEPPDLRSDVGIWKAAMHPDDQPITPEDWERVVAEGRSVTLEHRLITPRGVRWISINGRAMPGTGRFVGVYADITERRAAQALLETRVAEAVAAAESAQAQLAQAQKMEALGQLTGGVAHDFNNLLQVVASGAALLAKRPALAEDRSARRLLDGVAGAAERGAALTRRMLAFARRQELRMEAVDSAVLIGSMRDLLARSLGPATPLDIDLPDGLWAAHADPNQLELALLNLCVNARDAMPPDRFPQGRVRIGARNAPAGPREGSPGAGDPPPVRDCLVITVTDQGAGMDAETLARATEPFFTTKGVGRGTGLGLSMVHGLCAQSGGALRLISAPGEGTVAEIWLPRAEPGEEPAPAQPGGAVVAGPARRLRVLVVDDDPLVLASSVALLVDLGHSTREADSAGAALALLQQGRWADLVLTDHAMPGMTGMELAARIATLCPGLPVILASGYADLPAGMAPDLPRLDKPFGREALAAALARMFPAGEAAEAASPG